MKRPPLVSMVCWRHDPLDDRVLLDGLDGGLGVGDHVASSAAQESSCSVRWLPRPDRHARSARPRKPRRARSLPATAQPVEPPPMTTTRFWRHGLVPPHPARAGKNRLEGDGDAVLVVAGRHVGRSGADGVDAIRHRHPAAPPRRKQRQVRVEVADRHRLFVPGRNRRRGPGATRSPGPCRPSAPRTSSQSGDARLTLARVCRTWISPHEPPAQAPGAARPGSPACTATGTSARRGRAAGVSSR